MKKILLLLLVLLLSAFAADKYGVYDIQGNRISTFEAEPNEVREKIKQIKSSYPYKKIFVSSLQKGKVPVPTPTRNYRFKTGSYVEAARKESFSLCPEKDTEGTWASEYSVGLNEENCVIIQTPNLAGSFDVFFLKESGFADSIQVLVDQSYIEMENYSHKIFVPDTAEIRERHQMHFDFSMRLFPGAYESRKYDQTLIVDKTKFTMGDAQYYAKTNNMEDLFSPWHWDEYPENENLEESNLPVIEVADWHLANERSKKEGLDTAYVRVSPKYARGLILMEDPERYTAEFYSCESCTALFLDTSASGYRLPFDYEWFYLARAGASTKYHWGDGEDSLTVSAYEWVRPTKLIGSKEGTLKPVAQLRPNQFGLYDMLGIARERWVYEESFFSCGDSGYPYCEVCYVGYPECVLINKIAPRYQYMGKTGGYTIGTGEYAKWIEAKDTLMTEENIYVGFRLVRKTPKLHKLEKF